VRNATYIIYPVPDGACRRKPVSAAI
jgi:hypothetical protein